MQFSTLIFASLASLALGQVTSTSSAATATSTCAAQNVLDACVSQTKGQVNACTANDWDCLCTAYGVVLVCYNNCPGDAGVFGVQQQRDQYCAAASAYGTKTSSSSATVAATTSTTATALTLTTSATGSAATASTTRNAAAIIQVGSGMFAVAFAGLGLLA